MEPFLDRGQETYHKKRVVLVKICIAYPLIGSLSVRCRSLLRPWRKILKTAEKITSRTLSDDAEI